MTKYRITHPDPLNWCIEEWQEGGEKIERGRYSGGLTVAKWKAPQYFYPTLRLAALALLDKASGDAIMSGEANDILTAIKVAEAKVVSVLESMGEGARSQSN